jgi:hypothetical protein
MSLIIDTHVHVYPEYDLAQAMATLARTLRSYDPEAELAAILAERFDCRFFADVAAGRLGAAQLGGDVEVLEGAVRITQGDDRVLLFPGRQVVTSERIEVLALTVDQSPPDGLPARDVVAAIRDNGGVPVVAWAPGKWLFRRRPVVAKLIRDAAPGTLWLGDTSLRPTIWAEPLLMRAGRRKGLGVVAGSDPLPAAGEEAQMGRFVTRMEGSLSEERPVEALRAALRGPCCRVGRRCGPLEVLRRLRRYKGANS